MRKFSILMLTVVLIFAFFAPAKPTEAVVLNPTLWISPQKRLVATGSTVIIEVKLTEATFSYGLNCQIEYDPQMLEIDKESVIEGEYYRQDGAPTYFLREIIKNPKNNNKILVVDDYAHHPTETTATLLGIRSGLKRRLIAVFQTHLYSRTRDFYAEFGRSFLNSDIFICTDVYPAREQPIE